MSFALLDQLDDHELVVVLKHQRSKKNFKKKSLFRQEYSLIAFDHVLWFYILTFMDFKFLFHIGVRIDKMRCEMNYSKPICHHVLMCEFKTLLNGEEEKDTL